MSESDKLEKLVQAVDMLCMSVLVLANVCDVKGHVFNAVDAETFTRQWSKCRELIDEAMEDEK